MEKIYDRFLKNGIQYFVSVYPLKFPDAYNVLYVRDARSAGFYAMGIALKNNSPVVVFVPGEYIANLYTSITEAWFQKAKIIVVATYNSVQQMKTSWMDRCTIKNFSLSYQEFIDEKEFEHDTFSANGPVAINLLYLSKMKMVEAYDEIISKIKQIDPYGKFISYACDNDNIEKNIIYNVEQRHLYGALSKYIGASVVKKIGYFVCNIDPLLVDLSIFRTRYANGNMKIAINDCHAVINDKKIDEWFLKNNWCIFRDTSNDEIKHFCKSDKPSILIGG